MEERIKKYNNLAHKFVYMDNKTIKDICKKTSKSDGIVRWGQTGIVNINGIKVFYKKLPLAKLFEQNQLDTSNLYKLPAYYNYGYGSAGINPWRELITHINLSEYVISGEIPNFPILYHWRVIEDEETNFHSGFDEKLLKRFGNNPQIKKYLEDRLKSKYKIIIFLEFIPNVLYEYIKHNPKYLKKYDLESKKILDFLKSKGILDLDAHWGNYLVDSDSNLYLTDFGLVLDKNFNLDLDEKKFMNSNAKLPYFYAAESVYSFCHYQLESNPKLNKEFTKELKNQLGKMNYVNTIIKSIDYIIKILQLPKIYAQYIKSNKSKIIRTIQLKYDFDNSTDKTNIYL